MSPRPCICQEVEEEEEEQEEEEKETATMKTTMTLTKHLEREQQAGSNRCAPTYTRTHTHLLQGKAKPARTGEHTVSTSNDLTFIGAPSFTDRVLNYILATFLYRQ